MNKLTCKNYDSPRADIIEIVHEGMLCTSSNTIKDIPFEFDENDKE